MDSEPTLYRLDFDGIRPEDRRVFAESLDMLKDFDVLVPVEPDEIMLIGKYGIEGEHMDRIFQADYAGEVGTSRLKQGTYAIIKIGDTDE